MTQSGEENFGYDIYSGSGENESFLRVNYSPLFGAGATHLPQRYQFSDDSIQADTIYWSYLKNISLNEGRARLTPVYASRPKSGSLW